MAHIFHYDSRDHHQPLDRKKRFWGYVLALLFLSAAVWTLYRYFTHWGGEESDASRLLDFIGGFVVGLVGAGIIAFIAFGFRKMGYASYQYLTIDESQLRWQFNRRKGPQAVALENIKYGIQDPRHLIIKTKGGEEIWLENYLLADQVYWQQFIEEIGKLIHLK